jgi:hypothetical protein
MSKLPPPPGGTSTTGPSTKRRVSVGFALFLRRTQFGGAVPPRRRGGLVLRFELPGIRHHLAEVGARTNAGPPLRREAVEHNAVRRSARVGEALDEGFLPFAGG